MIAIALLGCHPFKDKNIPEELLGVWETSEPRYANCTFTLKQEMIIFSNPVSHLNVNFISNIEKFIETDRILFEIFYGDTGGGEYKLSLFYCKTPNGGEVRFRNQMEIVWTKKKITTQG